MYAALQHSAAGSRLREARGPADGSRPFASGMRPKQFCQDLCLVLEEVWWLRQALGRRKAAYC